MIKVTACDFIRNPVTLLINPESFVFIEAGDEEKKKHKGCETMLVNNHNRSNVALFIKETIDEVIALIGRSGNYIRSTRLPD